MFNPNIDVLCLQEYSVRGIVHCYEEGNHGLKYVAVYQAEYRE